VDFKIVVLNKTLNWYVKLMWTKRFNVLPRTGI